MKDLKIGIQLFSVKNALKADPMLALRKISECGYRYIEAANHNALKDDGVGFDLSAEEFKAELEKNGLEIVGCHVYPLDTERLPKLLGYQRKLGNRQIGCAMEVYPYNDAEYLKNICAKFNEVGKICRDFGLRYYYHNHYEEFQRFPSLGGKTVYDFIMENTDPSLVYAELDTYWAYRAGQDAVKLMEKYSDRLILLHQKDFSRTAPQKLNIFDGEVNPDENITMETFGLHNDPLCYTEIGDGTLPIKDILSAAEKLPLLEYVLLEQDATQLEETESIRRSMENFRKLLK